MERLSFSFMDAALVFRISPTQCSHVRALPSLNLKKRQTARSLSRIVFPRILSCLIMTFFITFFLDVGAYGREMVCAVSIVFMP